MLISRGLRALLWSAFTLAAQGLSSAARDESNIRSRADYVPREPNASRNIQRRNGTTRRGRTEGRTNGRLRSRQEERCEREECSSDATSADAEDNDAEDDQAGDVPTVTLTTTVLRTLTTGSGTTTTIVSSTTSQTLTFVDPALPTQTNTLTVTAPPPSRRRPRQVSVPQTGARGDILSSGEAQPTAGGASDAAGENGASATQAINAETGEEGNARTTTTTVERLTTVEGVVTVTSTVVDTEFVTVTSAPSATATEVTTTTVQPTPGVPDDIPDGLTPPQDEDPGSQDPPALPSETPDDSPLPSTTGPNPTEATRRLPPDVTDTLPSPTPTDPNNPQSMQPSADASPTNDPSRPVAGGLTADELAGVALGIIFGLLFLILAGFLAYRLVRKRQAAALLRSHQEMSSSGSGSDYGTTSAGGSVLSDPTRSRLVRPAPAASGSSAATSPGEGDVRIVIRPAPKRRTQSSGLLPSDEASRTGSTSSERVGTRSQWPRPPGYRGQTYSFFIERSRSASPVDAGRWSVASEQGSPAEGSDGAARWGAGQGGGGGGGQYLGVARALSPWKAV